MPSVISTHNLTRSFRDHIALKDLTIDVQSGEIFGFLGHNGAGKTTTVRLLNGLLEPDSGNATVLGYDPILNGPQLRQLTGVLTETPSADERLSAYESLSIFASIYGVARATVRPRIDELLDFFGLTERAHDRVGSYSKGMKQRLALARAMIHHPTLLFLDEPTSGLDPIVSRQFYELITDLSRRDGTTVFLCTHNLIEAQRLCDRVAILEQGELRGIGTPLELAHQFVADIHLVVTVEPSQVPMAVETLFPRQINGSDNNIERGVLRIRNVARNEIPGIIESLVQAGIGIYRVDHEEPSLEDVYFALHTNEDDRA